MRRHRLMILRAAEFAVVCGLSGTTCVPAASAIEIGAIGGTLTTKAHKQHDDDPASIRVQVRVVPTPGVQASSHSDTDVSVDVDTNGHHSSWHRSTHVETSDEPPARTYEAPRAPAPLAPRRPATNASYHDNLPFTGQDMAIALTGIIAVLTGTLLLLLSRIRRKRRASLSDLTS